MVAALMATAARAEDRPHLFEVSAGSALSTPVADIGRYGDDEEVVPNPSAFFLAEYFIAPEFRVALAYDLPTGTAVRFVRGEKREHVVPSRVFAGLMAAPFQFAIAERGVLELQGGALVGVQLDEDPDATPRFIGRLHASQDAKAGVGVYLGMRYLMRINELSVLYGVGYRF
ncbi:MAG: hypothetical protein R3F60_17275 [bacterium]